MRISLLLTCALALAFIPTAHAQIPNGGFESWYNNFNYADPVGWWTTNAVTFSLDSVPSCEDGIPGAVGASFAKVTTRDLGSFGVEIGHITIGDPALGFPGFPFTQRPAALTGQWQYYPQGADHGGYVHGELTRWNNVTHQRDVIGVCTMTATGPISGWQPFSATITYLSGLDPDTAGIHIEASAGGGTAVGGTSIWVDDLSFGNVLGVPEQSALNGLQVYPSPAIDRLHIVAGGLLSQMTIEDMSGRELEHASINGFASVVDIGKLPAGVYIASVRSMEGAWAVRRFIKD